MGRSWRYGWVVRTIKRGFTRGKQLVAYNESMTRQLNGTKWSSKSHRMRPRTRLLIGTRHVKGVMIDNDR